VAGPLGISSNAPSNLTLGFASTPGTLRYTGATATTDRGIFFSSGTMGTLEVSSPDANLSITGQIVGDTVTKTGPGRLTLGNGTNSFTDGVSILEGTLAISNRTAIPANANVAVGPDAEFRLEYTLGSNASAPIGALIMDSNARFTAENTLASSYFLNRIDQNGGRIELQGSSSFDVNLTGAGARIDLRGTVTWSGTSNSRIVNDTTAQIDLSIAPGGMLGNLIPLANGSNGHGFRLTGGGTIWVHTAESTADLTVADSTTLRFSAMENLGSGDITLHGGKLEYTGTSAPFAKAISLGSGGGTISVTNPATNVDWNAPITGAHTLTKAGRGSLLLIDGSQDLGGLVIDGGRVDVSNDAVLGRGAVVVNSAGTLRFRNNSTTGRTFILNGGTLEAPSGGTLALDTATINGGFLHSPGGGRFSVLDFAELYGSTMFGGTAVDVNGTAAFTNVTTGANIAVAVGQTLTLNRGLQTSSGTLNVHGIAIAPSGWESSGVIRITGGATPGRMTVGGAPLVLGGGSRTYIGANVAGQRGGTIDLGGGTLELNGGLLVNNGDFISAGNGGIQNGTVNVNYGSLAKGSGYYDSVNVTEGGKFAPGNSITDSGIGTLTLNSGSVYEFEINLANGLPGGGGTTPPQGWDRLSMNRMNVNSTAESPAIVQLVTRNASDTGPGTLPDFDPAQSYQWQAFQAEVFNGFAPDKFTFDTTQFANLTDPTGVGTFTLERSGSSVFVVYTPVPEPGLILVVVAGALAAARPARRLVLMASLKSQVG
jgi:autotransporter-associated beta strand protein